MTNLQRESGSPDDFVKNLIESVAPAEILTLQAELSTGHYWTDILAIGPFRQDPSNYAAMELFWRMCNPAALPVAPEDAPSKSGESLPQMPSNVEEGVLQALADLERERRVPYQPDEEWWEITDDLLVYIHLAGARAFRLRTKEGYSDDVRDLLRNILQTMSRMHPEGSTAAMTFCTEAPVLYISAAAITSLALVDLFRIARLDGNYGEALHFLAESLYYYGDAIINREQPSEDLWFPENVEHENTWQWRLEEYLSPLDVDPQEVVDTFEQLRAGGRGVDWKQVAQDSKALAEWWADCLREQDEVVVDGDGTKWEWFQFWRVAQGWAEAQLRPSDLRDLLDETEDRAAERRLKTYFFDSQLWDKIPARAQRSLIDAERSWFSTSAGRIESTFNHLKVAMESLLYSMFWEPLRSYEADEPYEDFRKRDSEIRGSKHNPGLADYIRLCNEPLFKRFVADLELNRGDTAFLNHDLPQALRRLSQLRNPAEHDPTRRWHRREVEPIVCEILGIHRYGRLRRLLEIQTKAKAKC